MSIAKIYEICIFLYTFMDTSVKYYSTVHSSEFDMPYLSCDCKTTISRITF